jgi:hypothetical protein
MDANGFMHLGPEALQNQITILRLTGFTWSAISRLVGTSRRKLRLYFERFDMQEPLALMEDNEQTRLILRDYVSMHPHAGEITIMGYLRGKGYNIRRRTLREILLSIDPDGRQNRLPRGKTPRIEYNAFGPGYIWHIDTWHKLGLTCGIVVVSRQFGLFLQQTNIKYIIIARSAQSMVTVAFAYL